MSDPEHGCLLEYVVFFMFFFLCCCFFPCIKRKKETKNGCWWFFPGVFPSSNVLCLKIRIIFQVFLFCL